MHQPDPVSPLERRPRALVLHGDDGWLAGLERALAERSVTTVTARDGQAGLERLLEEFLQFDVLVMDLHLARRDARSLAQLIRGAGNERDLAIVVLATAPTPALRAELRALGVDAVVDGRNGPAVAAAAVVYSLAARIPELIELEAQGRPQATA